MALHKQLFRKVTIIGIGLMGGSIGLAIKKRGLAREVVGLSQRHTTLVAAVKRKAVDSAYQDIKKAVSNADLVILATPISIITGMMSLIAPHLKRSCIVTDVGSTKCSIVSVAGDHLPNPSMFIGSHPLAGSEKKGVQNADPDLFEGTECIITPTDKTNRATREKIKRFWFQVGARVRTLTPEQHDKVLAYVSHLPHLLAYSLMETIPDNFIEYGAGGLRDTTRIASSSPQVWNDICLGNAKNIIVALDELVKTLSILRTAIRTEDQKTILEHFKVAKSKRDRIV